MVIKANTFADLKTGKEEMVMIKFKFKHDGTKYDVEGRVISPDPSDWPQEVEFKFFLDGSPVDLLNNIKQNPYAYSTLHWVFSKALEDQLEDDKEVSAVERHENILLNGGWLVGYNN